MAVYINHTINITYGTHVITLISHYLTKIVKPFLTTMFNAETTMHIIVFPIIRMSSECFK